MLLNILTSSKFSLSSDTQCFASGGDRYVNSCGEGESSHYHSATTASLQSPPYLQILHSNNNEGSAGYELPRHQHQHSPHQPCSCSQSLNSKGQAALPLPLPLPLYHYTFLAGSSFGYQNLQIETTGNNCDLLTNSSK